MFVDCEKQKAPLWLPSVLDELAGSQPGTEKINKKGSPPGTEKKKKKDISQVLKQCLTDMRIEEPHKLDPTSAYVPYSSNS